MSGLICLFLLFQIQCSFVPCSVLGACLMDDMLCTSGDPNTQDINFYRTFLGMKYSRKSNSLSYFICER